VAHAVTYYRIRQNWHKHPLVSRLMCWLGRHDYEPESVRGREVTMRCFYCQQSKRSRATHAPS